MATGASFENFEKELSRLVESFGHRLAELKRPSYVEAQLRDDFLNPFFRALGWDMENRAGLIQQKREVEIESRTQIGGRQKRADYLFRTDGRDRFVCEAKKPAEELHSRYAFQAKRYAWNKDLPLALVSFNVGVEIGQIAFVLITLALERGFRQLEIRWSRWAELLPGYVVGSLGAFWTIQRVAIMLGGK